MCLIFVVWSKYNDQMCVLLFSQTCILYNFDHLQEFTSLVLRELRHISIIKKTNENLQEPEQKKGISTQRHKWFVFRAYEFCKQFKQIFFLIYLLSCVITPFLRHSARIQCLTCHLQPQACKNFAPIVCK